MKLWPLFALSLIAVNPALGEEKKTEEKKAEQAGDLGPTKLVCHGPHEERVLEIVSKGSGCVLNYTKQKETKEMARAQYDVKACHSAMKKIRDRLESGNFACE